MKEKWMMAGTSLHWTRNSRQVVYIQLNPGVYPCRYDTCTLPYPGCGYRLWQGMGVGQPLNTWGLTCAIA